MSSKIEEKEKKKVRKHVSLRENYVREGEV